MKKLGAVLALAVAGAGMWPQATHAAPPAHPRAVITDPRLLGEMQKAAQRRSQSADAPAPKVTAEVLTDDVVRVADALQGLGARVTGSVPGAVVQADVPYDRLTEVANLPGVTDIRYPRRSGYVPSPGLRTARSVGSSVQLAPIRTEGTIGFGPTMGNEVIDSNAGTWHGSGFLGTGVKVGIVDYFDFAYWDTAEHGPVPDAAHKFCLDFGTTCTIGIGFLQDVHGTAVAEVVKDMAPGAELYVATVSTVSDLRAAIDWFSANGVRIMTRSLGAAFDGPGDGTGPLDSAVDYAVSKGITWFNSAGNDAAGGYARTTVPTSLPANGYVNFSNSGTADTWLMVITSPGQCFYLDGIRWANDWSLPALQRSDYQVEVYGPNGSLPTVGSYGYNPSAGQTTLLQTIDARQTSGASPLEGPDAQICPGNSAGAFKVPADGEGVVWLRVKLRNSVGAVPDSMEVGIAGSASIEPADSDKPSSAAKPVVDSRNTGLVAVGAVEANAIYTDSPQAANTVAYYSSRGPTNDGRVKPDMSATSGMASATYSAYDGFASEFHGTSSASPTAAGAAALLAGAGLAMQGTTSTTATSLAALVKHFTVDKGSRGPDNNYGFGFLTLPTPPDGGSIVTTPSKYVPELPPQRLLDTRSASHVGPADLIGPYAPQSIIELDVTTALGVPASDVSAVAVNITSVNTTTTGHIQAYPYLRGQPNATSTLNVSTPSIARPNFTIVPVGQDGMISIYLYVGGDVIVDLLGSFQVPASTPVADGRFVPLATPERWLDTRPGKGGPLPPEFNGTARLVNAGETITVPRLASTALPAAGVGTQVEALVVNITVTGATTTGHLMMYPGGYSPLGLKYSNVNFVKGATNANGSIVPIVPGFDNLKAYLAGTTHVIVDVVGYITSSTATGDDGFTGLYVPATPTRVYDSRAIPGNCPTQPLPNSVTKCPFAAGEHRTITVTGGTTGLPAGVVAVAANLTVVNASGSGHLRVYPGTEPAASNLNYVAGKAVANGGLIGVDHLSTSDTVTAMMYLSGNFILDINGYFVSAPPPP